VTSEQAITHRQPHLRRLSLFWVISDSISIPHQLFSVAHELQGPNGLGYSVLNAFKASYFVRVYILNLAENILHIALWLMAAGWFYRCGPRVQRFFNDADVLGTDQPTLDTQ
jgi:hypothetical protein